MITSTVLVVPKSVGDVPFLVVIAVSDTLSEVMGTPEVVSRRSEKVTGSSEAVGCSVTVEPVKIVGSLEVARASETLLDSAVMVVVVSDVDSGNVKALLLTSVIRSVVVVVSVGNNVVVLVVLLVLAAVVSESAVKTR